MGARVLVAYVSRMGSTAEIAQAVAKELEASGARADAREMQDISSLEGYQALVVGAPVYTGKLLKELGEFAARHRDALLEVPVAAFAVGIAPVYPKAGSRESVLENLRDAFDPVRPVAVTMFAGKLDPAKMSFLERSMMKLMKVPAGDFRDWEAIRAWARELPALLRIRG